MKYIKILGFAAITGVATLVSCADEGVKPTLGSDETFVAPVLLNSATADPVEFSPENENDEFEMLEWKNASYGLDVSIRYVVQADKSDEFLTAVTVKEVQGRGDGSNRSVGLLNREVNNAMLALGIAPGEEATVHLRVFSFINGINRDTLPSNAIERTATPYRSSDCGNYCTVAIVGEATAGGWDVDTDMHLADPSNKYVWTITTYLTAGPMKFRAQDGWEVNWGADAFPSGTGTQDGPNIPIPSPGYYKITLNDQNGEYSITAVGATTYSSMGLIGEQSSWGDDIFDLTQSDSDPHVWTGTVTLDAGELKFRAEDSWAVNWGATSYPSGYAVQDGGNVTIPAGGTYFVYLNDVSGEYFFAPSSASAPVDALGIVGSATPGAWDSDTDLVQDPSNPYKWSGILTLSDGEGKFRADDGWDVNWGASTFPSGVGVQDGANIPVLQGTYFITINSATGEYSFLR